MDRLLKDFTISEIEHKTHISPMTLEKLVIFEFDGLYCIKLKGFIKILKNEYKDYDFSELENSINEYCKNQQNVESNVIDILEDNSKGSSFKVYFLVIILIIGIGGLIYYLQKQNKSTNVLKHTQSTFEINETNLTPIKTLEVNISTTEVNDTNSSDSNVSNDVIKDNENIESNNTKIIESKLNIIPKDKVWFKISYLDTNHSKQHLISTPMSLDINQSVFIKFGNGMMKLVYNNQTLDLSTRKIIRVIIKDGNMSITKKRLNELK